MFLEGSSSSSAVPLKDPHVQFSATMEPEEWWGESGMQLGTFERIGPRVGSEDQTFVKSPEYCVGACTSHNALGADEYVRENNLRVP